MNSWLRAFLNASWYPLIPVVPGLHVRWGILSSSPYFGANIRPAPSRPGDRPMKSLVLCLVVLLLPSLALCQSYDFVVQGGRVIDPETGLDAVRNVGISQGKIKKISAEALEGKRVIAAKGLVVAPGFIDLHQHDLDQESQRLKALDGVTTALEMEIGKPDV